MRIFLIGLIAAASIASAAHAQSSTDSPKIATVTFGELGWQAAPESTSAAANTCRLITEVGSLYGSMLETAIRSEAGVVSSAPSTAAVGMSVQKLSVLAVASTELQRMQRRLESEYCDIDTDIPVPL